MHGGVCFRRVFSDDCSADELIQKICSGWPENYQCPILRELNVNSNRWARACHKRIAQAGEPVVTSNTTTVGLQGTQPLSCGGRWRVEKHHTCFAVPFQACADPREQQ